jgi:hypothetical protein
MILITSILKCWKNFNRERIIKNLFIPRVPVNPPPPPALPKDASTLSAEANRECQDTNKELSEKYLVFGRFNCSLATQYLLKHRKSQFVTKKSTFELASKRNSEKQIIIFDMFLSKIKIFLKIAFFSVYVLDQIKKFCFRTNYKRTKAKCFAFVPLICFLIETFVVSL